MKIGTVLQKDLTNTITIRAAVAVTGAEDSKPKVTNFQSQIIKGSFRFQGQDLGVIVSLGGREISLSQSWKKEGILLARKEEKIRLRLA